MRSPDAAWVRRERFSRLSRDQKSGFLPLCPEFVIKIQSSFDSLPRLKRKMPIWPPSGQASKNVKNRPGTSFTPAESYN
jgi:Uma2 family endonuclease